MDGHDVRCEPGQGLDAVVSSLLESMLGNKFSLPARMSLASKFLAKPIVPLWVRPTWALLYGMRPRRQLQQLLPRDRTLYPWIWCHGSHTWQGVDSAPWFLLNVAI